MEIILNADKAIAGRLAQYVAKQALLGHTVKIVNSELAVISGRKEFIVAKYKAQRDRGSTPFKGPFVSRLPDRFLRRIIRGMLPYKQGRGKEAFKNIMCYLGVPEELKDKKAIKLERASLLNSNIPRYATLLDICRALGAKQ